ncbi:MAG TPA: FHA domain-containing protein, partial [Geminicoccaceae bacterium]
MRCKIRFVSRQANGGVSFKEQAVEVQGRRVKLGRGTDNDVFLKDLRVNFRHADILIRDTDLVVEAVGESPLKVDGVAMSRGALAPGTQVEVGPYRVGLLAAEPGADLTLEVELLTPAPTGTVEQLMAPGGLKLEGTVLGKRALSWALFLAVLAVGLGLPVAAYLTKAASRNGAEAPAAGMQGGARPTLTFD